MYLSRNLENALKSQMFRGKVLILFGPRQAGKTTLVGRLTQDYASELRYIDCELVENRDLLSRPSTGDLFSLVRKYKVVVFDEAQVIPNIGSVLKSLFDHHPEVQYIATGSSSFDLANKVSEPLTGRSLEFVLYPLSLSELVGTDFDAQQILPQLMRFGGYPDIQGLSEDEKIFRLKTLVSQYLYKNVLSLGNVKKPEIIIQLLKLLAYQIGNEVSFRELATALQTSQPTIERYVDLLEKNYVVVRLGSYSRNLRNEVTRSKKIYFLDLGIRNALIDAFSPIDTVSRNDVGQLFENCMVVERLKHLTSQGKQAPASYFWRTFDQQEVDYIEETGEGLRAWEFKWNVSKSGVLPKTFRSAYPDATFVSVTPRNAYAYVTS
ncbi:MAG: ATP-binding protein [Patescibacteria group bacterium]